MKKIHRRNGVTLIELLIAIAISSILGLGLVSLQYILSQSQIAITKSYKSIDSGNYAISNMIKEIRGARSSENGAYLLNSAGDQNIVFYSDVDLDGKVEWVSYHLDGTNIIKETIKPTGYPSTYDPLDKVTVTTAQNIRNGVIPIFYYYNEDWPTDTVNNPLPVDNRLAETKTIKISIRVNVENNSDKDYTFESYAQIRSAKENL